MAHKGMITEEIKELIREVAKETASAVCIENATGQIDFYKAMEMLLNNYTKLAALVGDEEAYLKIDLQSKSKSIVTFALGAGGYNGTKTDDEIIEDLRRQRAVQYQKTKARFDEVDRVIQLFKNRKEFHVIRMYYFGEDAQGNKCETPYTFEKIAEELESLGLLKDERTARRWRSRIVTDMAVCMFGSAAAIGAGRIRRTQRKENQNVTETITNYQ